jgi:hypothetical protein
LLETVSAFSNFIALLLSGSSKSGFSYGPERMLAVTSQLAKINTPTPVTNDRGTRIFILSDQAQINPATHYIEHNSVACATSFSH